MLTLVFTILLWAHKASGLEAEELDSLTPANKVLRKHLQQGDVWAFSVGAPARDMSSANIQLTLTTLNEDGDADLFCLPEKLSRKSDALPSSLFSVWKSTKSQGQDMIFVSIYHALYSLVLDQEGSANLICTATGFAILGSDVEIELEADYSEKFLAAEEQEALESLFDKCCDLQQQQIGCLNWMNKKSARHLVCHHPGVICDSGGHLLSISLSKFGFDCPFPLEAIKKLKFLRTLDLSQNRLTGDIEKILLGLSGSLPDLVTIDFSLNDLGGSLESKSAEKAAICSMTHGNGTLRLLNLESNFVEGRLPACLFDADSNLREVVLGGSRIQGQVPKFSAESRIQIVRLDNTGLTGTIPEVFGELQSLAVLDLSDNLLTGTIPSNIGDCPKLRTLRLEANTLQGTIPDSIAFSTSLSVVRLEINELTSFPDSFHLDDTAASSVLKVFDASRNQIQGEFPQFLFKAPRLTVLNLGDNKLNGLLPSQPGIFPEVVVLQLGSNQFEGPLPEALGSSRLFNLQVGNVSITPQLDLTGNNLRGRLPSFLMNLPPGTIVPTLYFQGNYLEMDCFGDAAIRTAVVQSGVFCSEDSLQSDLDLAPMQEPDSMD